MRPLTVEYLSRGPSTSNDRRRLIAELERGSEDRKAMAELHAQNAELAEEQGALEENMRQQKTLADVATAEQKANANRHTIDSNNRTILDHIYAILNRR